MEILKQRISIEEEGLQLFGVYSIPNLSLKVRIKLFPQDKQVWNTLMHEESYKIHYSYCQLWLKPLLIGGGCGGSKTEQQEPTQKPPVKRKSVHLKSPYQQKQRFQHLQELIKEFEQKQWSHTNVLTSNVECTNAIYSPDSRYIAMSSRDNITQIWDAEDGSIQNLEIQGNVFDYTPDGKFIFIGGEENNLKIISSQTLETHTDYGEESYWISCLAYDSQRCNAITGDNKGNLKIWEYESGVILKDIVGHQENVTSLQFREGYEELFSSSTDGNIKVWNAQLEIVQTLCNLDFKINSMHLLDEMLTAGMDNGDIRLWNSLSYALIIQFSIPDACINAIRISNQKNLICVGCSNANIHVFNLFTFQQIAVLSEHSQQIKSLRFSNDDAFLLTSSDDKTVKLWYLALLKRS